MDVSSTRELEDLTIEVQTGEVDSCRTECLGFRVPLYCRSDKNALNLVDLMCWPIPPSPGSCSRFSRQPQAVSPETHSA